jgi:mannose-1-phosphate guanylyltransferase
MKGILLTAGLGTRLRPVTDQYAKPAVPFLGVPLLYYPLTLMEEAGVKELVLNTHHKPEQIELLSKDIPNSKLKVALSPEREAPLGSGGGIWNARRLLEGGGNFLVSNGDEVILEREPNIMKRFVAEHLGSQAIATILAMRHPLVGTQFGGVWADSHGNVLGFGKDASKFGSGATGFHYIGLLLLNDRVFTYMPDGESNILYDTLSTAIEKGECVRTVVSDFTWYETGNPRDFLHATSDALKLLAFGEGPDALALITICQRFWKPGCSLKTSGDAITLVGDGAFVDSSAKLSGFNVIGDNAVIESSAQIRNTVILPNTKVPKSQTVSNEIWLKN